MIHVNMGAYLATQREQDAELVNNLGPAAESDGTCPCESYDCQGQCCGPGKCTCTTTAVETEGDPTR